MRARFEVMLSFVAPIAPFAAIALCAALSTITVTTPAVAATPSPAVSMDYLTQVKPLLKARCYTCHGALKQQSGLRLDTAASILKGGKSGAVVAPGAPEKSVIVRRVSTTDVEQRMPPEHEGNPLSREQVDLIRNWIAAGAPAPKDEKPEGDPLDHWAFRPRVRPAVPVVTNANWVRNSIDAFIADGYQQHGLTPQPQASRAVLLRRLYVDLIGIPPTLEQMAAAERDPASDWYEKTVDQLLADPRYGERWGRHWMDVWRYSEWWGLGEELRNSQKQIWHWRDWIVESLNADLGYDEMVREMLAADELYPADPKKIRATGYLARNYFLFNRDSWLEDTVEHVGKGFLGLTMNCAKCHDHKFDPIRQADYYAMRAIFEPYQVRNDLVPGETDIERDAIPRAFDASLGEPTYLYRRGDAKNPDKTAPAAPGVPRVFTFAAYEPKPVALPVESYRPGTRAYVVDAYLKRAEKRLDDGRKAVETAKIALADSVLAAFAPMSTATTKPAVVTTPVDQAVLAVRVAEKMLAGAEAQLASVRARSDADHARYLQSAAPNCGPLIASAVRAERLAGVAQAEEDVARAKLDQVRATAENKAQVDKKLTDADGALDAARKKVDEKAGDYTPIVGAVMTRTKFHSTTVFDADPGFPATSTGRRSALAAWITDPRNPLAARVAANHIWLRHMGSSLASSTFDFGRKTPDPANVQLLDWLASELVDGNWSMKRLHRLIVTSAAYRMSSSTRGGEANAKRDPDNVYYWHRPAIRLEAQVVRDSILSLAGDLDPTIGGPSVPMAGQDASKRRSLYFFHSNSDENPFLTTFDDAGVQECYRREQSVVPQQALALTNSKLVYDGAKRIASKLQKSPEDDTAFIRNAFLLVTATEPGDSEIASCRAALGAWRTEKASAEDARANLVWALLSHNDFVTLR